MTIQAFILNDSERTFPAFVRRLTPFEFTCYGRADSENKPSQGRHELISLSLARMLSFAWTSSFKFANIKRAVLKNPLRFALSDCGAAVDRL